MAEKNIRKWFRVYGDVQAVGFRYTARMLARRLDLTGYVRNEYDGSVIMEVQGPAEFVRDFPERVERASRWVSIDPSRTISEDLPLAEDEYGFEVE